MREWTLRQIEWYRDNKKLLPSQIKSETVFFALAMSRANMSKGQPAASRRVSLWTY